jgi:hypothetical protein
VQAPAPVELDGSDDEDRMDNIIADIGMEYELGSGDQRPPLEVQNFYRLLATSEEKVHDGTEMTVLQVVTRLMGMKLKYNFSNQCYKDIVKLVIDLIPAKHNMPKTCTSQRRLLSILKWTTRRLMHTKKLHVVLQGAQG